MVAKREPRVRVGRVYDEVGRDDGARVLVDGVWPRGVKRASLSLERWAKDVAPSKDLRQWFGHDPDRFEKFSRRYRDELTEASRRDELDTVAELAQKSAVTLLTATKDPDISHTAVLAEVLSERG